MDARTYICGPMRGRPEFGFPEFMGTEQDLRALDWVGDIFNPAQRDLDTGFNPTGMTGFENLNDGTHRFSLRDAFGADLGWIADRADVICLLPGWEKSSGALAEMALAAALGLKAGALWEIALVASSVDLRDAKDILDEMLDARAADCVKARIVEAPALTDAAHMDMLSAARITAAKPAGPRAISRATPAKAHTGKVYVPAHPDGPPVLWDPGDWEAMAVAQHVHSDEGRCVKARSGQFCPPIHTSGLPLTGDVPASSLTPNDEVRLTSSTGGQKGDKEARFDLIPVSALWWLAVLYGRGAKKYKERNWERGYDWHLSYASFQRHGNAFWNGEDLDPETGVPHLICAVFHAFGMVTWVQTHPEFDDRPARLQLAQPEVA